MSLASNIFFFISGVSVAIGICCLLYDVAIDFAFGIGTSIPRRLVGAIMTLVMFLPMLAIADAIFHISKAYFSW